MGARAIHPLDYRYGDERVREVFSRSERSRLMMLLEGRVALAQSDLGVIPDWAGPRIASAAESGIPLEKIWAREDETKHEVAAVVSCLGEASGDAGRFVHFGLTSNDVLDTVMSIQISEAGGRVLEMTRELAEALVRRAEETRGLLCVARTHGMHAEPYTYGLRFAVWLSEVVRCYERLSGALEGARVGKVSGAVGTYAAMGEKGPEVERRVLADLKLTPLPVTTQIVPRDILASVLMQLAGLSSVLDGMATTLRNLHRTEIAEVRERMMEGQVGSSAMPHKRNPIGCERVSGLARIVRGLSLASLENMVLWDERDLTNSSTERAVIPEMFGLVSEQLKTMSEVIRHMELDEGAIRRNLNAAGGVIFSGFVLGDLVRSGMGRGDAHRLLRRISEEVERSGADFHELLSRDETVSSRITRPRLKSLFDPETVLRFSDEIIERAIENARATLSS